MLTISAVFSFAGVFFLVLCVAAFTGVARHPIDRRISYIDYAKRRRDESPVFTQEKGKGLVASLGRRITSRDTHKQGDTKQRLAAAGYYSDVSLNTYWGLKILFITILPATVLIPYTLEHRPLFHALLPALIAIGAGLFAPDVYLFFKARKRRDHIFRALPDMLDLMVVCMEAGLGLDAATQKVSEEFHISNPILSRELHITCAAIRLGQARSEALHELADRTGVLDLKALVAVLIQSERFGTSVAQALRVHADDMRTRRKQKAEELAAKTTVKLIFPLVIFIFPSIFVVLGGPAVLRIIQIFIHKPI
ncbi:MAG: type II secretion system F family protein [bacterium]